MNRSSKIAPLCYICGNVGVVIWSVVLLLEGASILRSIFVLIISLLAMNLLLWLLFRAKDKGQLR
jgi:Flp pilus assembly protein TadB